MRYFILLTAFTFFSMKSFAQKQVFDLVSYAAPKGWQKTQNEGGLQLSVSDQKTGTYAIAIITKATSSPATATENFTTDWTRLVKSTVQLNGEPTMQDPSQENGWDIVSGSANYTDGNTNGVATLITATGGGQTVSVVLITNTQQYENELLSFINSLELTKVALNKNTSNPKNATGSPVVGLWTNYILETTGNYINNMPQYTSGYLRKEYTFFSDGTYLFRNKQWLVKAPTIVFQYETGTYTVNGNQLTLIPKTGKGGFWKKTKSTKEWGSLVKSSDYTLEKTTYTFQLIIDNTYGNSIVLKSSKPTQRDGGQFNNASDPYEFRYSSRKLESSIDNPPGWKISK